VRWARDWRWAAGAVSVGLVWLGLLGYGRARPWLDGLSIGFAGLVVSLALLGVLGTLGRTWRGFAAYLLALAVVAGLFARSQLRPDAFAPPIEEWAIAVGVVVGIAVFGLLVRRWIQAHRPTGHPPRVQSVLAGSLAGLVLAGSCCCAPFTKYSRDEPYDHQLPGALFQSGAVLGELLPLPPDVEIVFTDNFNPGAHGYGHDVFVFASTAGASHEQLLEHLTAYFAEHGWPLGPDPDYPERFRTGCRPVRGLVAWDDQCMMIVLIEGAEGFNGGPKIAGTVNVYLE
jgi:hypothetical protein